MQPEFSRPTDIRPLTDTGGEIALTANAEERDALARRFGIPAVNALNVRLRPEKIGAGMYQVSGHIEAALTRLCVRTLEPMQEAVDAAFEVRLIERAIFATMDEAHEEEPLDIEVIDGETVDLGELAAQYLSLLMDPYPRSHQAKALPALGEGANPAAKPFAALGRLKEKP
jgi:uncharacterized metal-binding protein YceD (DUF177 family)